MYQVDKCWDNCKYLHVPRRCFLYKRCISSSVARSAFLILFPCPLPLSCLRFADKCLNSMSFIMFIFVLSPWYLLMEDWMHLRVSGSYSSPFLFHTKRKNLARYWSSCADSISSKHLSSCSACNQLVNNFTSLFVFFRSVAVFHWVNKLFCFTFSDSNKPLCSLLLRHFYQHYCQQTTPEIPEVLSTRGSILGFFHERLNMDICPGREDMGIQLPVIIHMQNHSYECKVYDKLSEIIKIAIFVPIIGLEIKYATDLKLTAMTGWKWKCTREMISIFPVWTFNGVYPSVDTIFIPEHVFHVWYY